jgi:hypothetical protein
MGGLAELPLWRAAARSPSGRCRAGDVEDYALAATGRAAIYPKRVVAGSHWLPTARIVALAEVFDALCHARPHKHARTPTPALREIHSQRGRQFDPELVDVFLALDHERLLTASNDGAAAEFQLWRCDNSPPALVGSQLRPC